MIRQPKTISNNNRSMMENALFSHRSKQQRAFIFIFIFIFCGGGGPVKEYTNINSQFELLYIFENRKNVGIYVIL